MNNFLTRSIRIQVQNNETKSRDSPPWLGCYSLSRLQDLAKIENRSEKRLLRSVSPSLDVYFDYPQKLKIMYHSFYWIPPKFKNIYFFPFWFYKSQTYRYAIARLGKQTLLKSKQSILLC